MAFEGHDFVKFLDLIPDGMVDQQDEVVLPLGEVGQSGYMTRYLEG